METQGIKGLICKHISQCTDVMPWNSGTIKIKLVYNTTCRQSYLKKEIHQKEMQTFERNSCVMVTIWSDEKGNIIGSNRSDKINGLK